MAWSKRGASIAGVYLGVVALSAIPVAVHAGKLSGVYLLLSTVPWSLLSVLVSDEGWGMALIGFGAIVNAAILYGATAFGERRRELEGH